MAHGDSDQGCACGGSCGCQSSENETISLTVEEYTARLEQYLVDLKAEIAAVERELLSLKTPAEMAQA